MLDQSPAVAVTPPGSGREILRAALTFSMHQFLATVAIVITAPLAFSVFVDFVRPIGWILSLKEIGLLAQGPYFPIQIALALLLGWTLGHTLRHKSMFRVWILPCAALLIAYETYPANQPFVYEQFRSVFAVSAISHYFGRGCQIRNYCFGQVFITLPFYTAAAYSGGSWLARKIAVRASFDEPAGIINPWKTFLISGVIWLCAMLDLLSRTFAGLGLSLATKAVITVALVVIGAAATTLVVVAGSGLIGRKRLSKLFLFIPGNSTKNQNTEQNTPP
jgi:hypothetical protein